MNVKVSECGHFFEYENGTPFFYLGDTVWMLFNKLDEAEAGILFSDRAKKGFTVIQAVVFRDLFTPNTPNSLGVRPFATEEDMRHVRMNPRWIEHVKRLIHTAAEYGLIVGVLPTWGDKWNEHSNSAGPVIMDQPRAKQYGRFLSDSLSDCENIIWILGGDSPIRSRHHIDTVSAMAEGIRSGGGGNHLMTFHPCGSESSELFHIAPWLDFNVIQSSHHRPNTPAYLEIERLYAKRPPKPCFDMEPNYESSPMFIMRKQSGEIPYEPIFSAYDVRKSYYRGVLAGAAGFTYGNEPIRQLHRRGDQIHIHSRYAMPTWQESLSDPGSAQLSMFIELLKTRSYFTRGPAQELIINQQSSDPVSYITAAKCREGSYIIAYVPVRQVLNLDTSCIGSKRIQVSLYDPEGCELSYTYGRENNGHLMIVPERDLDTLVIIDAEVDS